MLGVSQEMISGIPTVIHPFFIVSMSIAYGVSSEIPTVFPLGFISAVPSR